MPRGKIKYYNIEKGYGFIAQDDGGPDVFIHSSVINSLYDEIRVGQRVKYKVTEGKKGLVGQDVEVLLTALEQRWLSQGKNLIPREQNNPNQLSNFNKGRSSFDNDERDDFGRLYVEKQIRQRTPMFFAMENGVERSAMIICMTDTTFTLHSKDGKQDIPKDQIKYCYKAEDLDGIESFLKKSSVKKTKKPSKEIVIDLEEVWEARREGYPVEVQLIEGELFRGEIDWLTENEIKLILSNSAKVVVFRHAIENLSIHKTEEQ